jgi:hypothetical protein
MSGQSFEFKAFDKVHDVGQKIFKDSKDGKDGKDNADKALSERVSKRDIAKEVVIEHLPNTGLEAQTASSAAQLELYRKVHVDKYNPDKIYYEKYPSEKYTEGPFTPFSFGGAAEARIASLELAVAQLMHFIPQHLRPDLSESALKQEPETQAQEPSPKQSNEEYGKKK